MNPTSGEKMKCDYQMLNYAPKVMIYRIGKWTPYKGQDQEIEMMLKIINTDDSKIKIGFSDFEDEEELKNPQEDEELFKQDKIAQAMGLNTDIELPLGKISLDLKNAIHKDSQGTVIAETATDKRSREELMEHCSEPGDVAYMYKIVANNCIMKFPVTPRKNFNVETDEVKFAFNLVLIAQRGGAEYKIPVVVNTGKLKLNTSGGNVSSAQSVVSGRQGTQEQRLASGKAQMLDVSAISHATEKEKMDESF